ARGFWFRRMRTLSSRSLRAERLARLASDGLTFVANAFTLVRLGGPHLADLRGKLADRLLVGTRDRDVGRVGNHDRHARPRLEDNLVGVADLKGHGVRLLQLRLIADADNLQLLGVAGGDALDHVGDQAPGQSVQRPALALVVGALDDHLLAGLVIADGDLAP